MFVIIATFDYDCYSLVHLTRNSHSFGPGRFAAHLDRTARARFVTEYSGGGGRHTTVRRVYL